MQIDTKNTRGLLPMLAGCLLTLLGTGCMSGEGDVAGFDDLRVAEEYGAPEVPNGDVHSLSLRSDGDIVAGIAIFRRLPNGGVVATITPNADLSFGGLVMAAAAPTEEALDAANKQGEFQGDHLVDSTDDEPRIGFGSWVESYAGPDPVYAKLTVTFVDENGMQYTANAGTECDPGGNCPHVLVRRNLLLEDGYTPPPG